MDVHDARKQRVMEGESARMKRIIADHAMQINILKEINSKTGGREGQETWGENLHGGRKSQHLLHVPAS